MVMSVNTNPGAMVALQSLSATNRQLGATQLRVTTGLKVNGPQDNAATFAIAQNMRGDIAGISAVKTTLALGQSITNVAIDAGKAHNPAWYAVVAATGAAATVLEYGGPEERFAAAAASVQAAFAGRRLLTNCTDPAMAAMVLPWCGAEAGPGYHRLLRSSGTLAVAAPVTNWLDRI